MKHRRMGIGLKLQDGALVDTLTGELLLPEATGVATDVLKGDLTYGPAPAAPTSSEFLVAVADAGLSAERVTTNTPTVTWDHATPGQAKANVPAATTAAAGVVELATDGEAIADRAVQGNDARLSNARTPTAHATTHQPGGSDAMAVDAVAATGSLRTLGTGAQQAAAGNHTHASGVASYSPGSFTLANEQFSVFSRHVKLTGAQRATLAGTSTLRIT